ncbi:uncharacterized protein PFL1_04317 [Pseudozyma flocculosa PF-1]|uniref:INO80 complex subunit F domain-containing protein n=2 Tax=Pseudozyma flocculosa TaxID=84751 RepID=A0A5C3FBH7_9BASI|nr:uncharacterized protein PFL1_04317 [Pseudozyma flocculosa PF-1]EPQ27990.1 hypothetical protein PFL1_04317 [Pseudozyma flocculosa PF-1]SPO41620.1 uncharacterized protein PSFLO_07102 [Pseudozyma flocculosa]
MSTQNTPNTQPVKTKSKAYSSSVAIQGDAAKYRHKYKELKKKTREIETENEKLHLKTLRIKRNIQRMRLERAILYERLEAETAPQSFRAPSHHYDAAGHPVDHYPPHHPQGGPSAATSYGPSYGAPVRSTPHASSRPGADPYAYPEHDDRAAQPYRYGSGAPADGSRAHSPTGSAVPHGGPPPAADRSATLRQYTPSVSPEESRDLGRAGSKAA